MTGTTQPLVVAVCRDGRHRFSKPTTDEIMLLAGLGVQGDTELHDELGAQGFAVEAGQLGENVTTRGLDLLALPRGTVLRLGPQAVLHSGPVKPGDPIQVVRPDEPHVPLDRV
jgi:MOSC domain-containing protein YiiM